MEKYDIFIEAGQSNAEGSGHGPVAEEYIPNDRVLYLTGSAPVCEAGDPYKIAFAQEPYVIAVARERTKEISGSEDSVGDLALSFAQDYIQAGLLEQDRKLLIIRSAVGGTGFMYNQWEVDAPLYRRMLDMTDYALSLNPDNRLMGMLWHQGEHEAFEGNKPERYRSQLLTFVHSVKRRYSCPDLPFICGGFCNEWVQKFLRSCTAIMQTLREVAGELNGEYVETDDLLSNNQKTGDGDDIHFCRESLRILGHRYFVAYQTVTQK